AKQIDHRIDMGISDDDSAAALGIAMGRGVAGMAAVLEADRPDLMLVLGDRYEMLAMASAAVIARVPVAHIAGGDITEGAFDDAIRHAISKLSSLHFTTNAAARDRLIQMGEDPARVYVTGSPGIDTILETPLMDRVATLRLLGLDPFTPAYLLATVHPPTLTEDGGLGLLLALLEALEQVEDIPVVFTGSNADPGARRLDKTVQHWSEGREKARFFPSLGSERYLSAVAHAAAVVGNSSSGLYEAPTLAAPTVNIGDRQSGRPRASSVIDCDATPDAIFEAIAKATATPLTKPIVNPYGHGKAAAQIAAVIAGLEQPALLVRKSFRDIR
ncbi:MAG: UDP-N-acetylglucosamine 2-epimerase, partial [Pseudomonadota bacterium]